MSFRTESKSFLVTQNQCVAKKPHFDKRMRDLIALHEAYKRGDLTAVKTLLGNPSDFPNCVGPRAVGEIVLQYAIYHSPVSFVRALLELGADPNYGNNGFPSLIAALSTDRPERYEIAKLLLAFGADIQQRGINDYTPLHYAAAKNDLRMIDLLLTHGADRNAKTGIDDFSTPLEEAEHRRFAEAVRMLKEPDKEPK
jgi:ankyrin repeat protein